MLVDINLLPQKERKKLSFLITFSCLLALIILIGGFYFWKVQVIKDEITSIDRQISITKKIAEKQEKNNDTVVSTDSVSKLKSAIEWVKEYPIQTIPVMKHLTSLLPERGFIQSFGYTESGSVTISVQFDNSREAAYFLDSLNHSQWIKEASLNSLAAAQSETETETNATSTVASNSQANTSSNANGATNQSTTDNTSTIDSQNNPNPDTTSGQDIQNNTANASTTKTNVDENTAKTSTTNGSTSNILPRYTGQFEIIFDKEAIKKIIKKNKQAEEGVKDS